MTNRNKTRVRDSASAPALPRLPRGEGPGSKEAPLATSFWFPADSVEAQTKAGSAFTYRSGKLWLGRTTGAAALPVGWMDDRHAMTFAPSRAGKGTSGIIPNLCDYPGSLLIIDPKGENAEQTAARRGFGSSTQLGLHQDVHVLDPFRTSKVAQEYISSFDALSGIRPGVDDALEKAAVLSEALVVTTDARDAHWDESAIALVEALILHVASWPGYGGDRSLGRVRQLLRDGDREELKRFRAQAGEEGGRGRRQPTAFDILLTCMEHNEHFDGVISGAASGLKDLGPRERGAILSTARRNLKFLDSPKMRDSLRAGDHCLDLADLKRNEKGVSVYLVLPASLMQRHARWLRVVLSLMIYTLQVDGAPPKCDHPVLAILDEFATLGHLPMVEAAAGYMAGFGLKIWAFLQDLSQLKRDYPDSWETFLGNAGLLQFFANTDLTTLEYLSRRLGEIEVVRETGTATRSETASVSDISDYDKVQRVRSGQGLKRLIGSFDLENDTQANVSSVCEVESRAQVIQKTQLMTPDEIRRYFSRASGLQIVALADYRPLILRRTPYYEDPHFVGKYVTEGAGKLPGQAGFPSSPALGTDPPER